MAKTNRWYSPRFARNLDACYTRASVQDKTEGLEWYSRAHQTCCDLAKRYNVSVAAACGVMAALSPGANWDKNQQDAQTFLEEWALGSRGKQLPLVGSYGWRNIVKASKIASGQEPLSVLGGEKVRAFYTCLVNPAEDTTVCIDRHAKCAALGEKLGDAGSLVKSKGEYSRLARHYVRNARKAGILPHQYQAVIWVTWRRLQGVLDQMDLEAYANEVPF